MVDIALVLRDGGLRRWEAAVLVWSDIERWDDGSGLLLVEQSKTDQTGEGEQDCSDGDASLPGTGAGFLECCNHVLVHVCTPYVPGSG